MRIFLFILTIGLLGCITSEVKAQKNDDLIQFSGVVVSNDSLQPVPFTSVMIRHSRRGTISDFYGFFSFVAMKGDTLDFQYIGFKPSYYVIPDTLAENRYSLIQVLVRDTINLKEAVVFPWPSREQFKHAFLELEIPGDDMARARYNLEIAKRREIAEAVPDDGSLNFKYAMQQQQSRLYSAGQYPSNNLMNPLAWAAFIRAWQDGAFKKKDDRR